MMIYDRTTLAFARKAEEMAKQILEAAGLKVLRNRFLCKSYLYPIRVVVFEGKELGHFNAPFLQIGLNKRLIYEAKDSVLRDILKHEIAHYLTHIYHGAVSAHGPEFKAVCAELGFPEDIAAATINLGEANLSKEGDLRSERIIEKVKKLLQLAQSSNVHEAELATLKANELLLRHNIEGLSDPEEAVYLDRILIQSRRDSKLVAIQDILKHFVVKPVLSFGQETVCLEVSGSATNVKLARYVAEFLYRELDHLWDQTKKEHRLSGLRAKNSFFAGVARGFEEKMKRSKASFSVEDRKALVVVEDNLKASTAMIYRRLSASSSSAQLDLGARELGVQKGRSLTIRNAVESTSSKLSLT